MTIAVILYIVSARELKKSSAGLPFSPASVMETPRNSAKTMICSMLALTMEAKAFFGNMFVSTCPSEGAALASVALARAMSMPAPGCMRLPSARPMAIAIAVVTR